MHQDISGERKFLNYKRDAFLANLIQHYSKFAKHH